VFIVHTIRTHIRCQFFYLIRLQSLHVCGFSNVYSMFSCKLIHIFSAGDLVHRNVINKLRCLCSCVMFGNLPFVSKISTPTKRLRPFACTYLLKVKLSSFCHLVYGN